jgi:hypothetical protein
MEEVTRTTEVEQLSATDQAFIRRTVTTIMMAIAVLTFMFSFGNIWALGRRLGVTSWVAPLVGPAVDLSVVGLLIGLHYLALHDVSPERLRSARVLLVFSGLATLALNAAEPVLRGEYGRAAFDAVGPLLLIGWSEVGPGLVREIHAVRPRIVRQSETADWTESAGNTLVSATGHEGGSNSPAMGDPTEKWKRDVGVLQRRAWEWAVAHRDREGIWPSGRQIAEAFERSPRWGRHVKRAGMISSAQPE